jgi:hypothetical protein
VIDGTTGVEVPSVPVVKDDTEADSEVGPPMTLPLNEPFEAVLDDRGSMLVTPVPRGWVMLDAPEALAIGTPVALVVAGPTDVIVVMMGMPSDPVTKVDMIAVIFALAANLIRHQQRSP